MIQETRNMGLISDLIHRVRGNPPATVAEIERALKSLASEREANRVALISLHERRRSLLLVDESDDQIIDLDKQINALYLVGERTEELEPALLQRLQQLRDADRRAQWGELQRRFDETAIEYVRAMRETIAGLEKLARIRAQAESAGFSAEIAHTMIAAPFVVAHPEINRFEAEIERIRESLVPRAVPVVEPVKLQPPKPQQAKPAAPLRTTTKQVTRRPPIKDSFAKGRQLVDIVRPGFETDDGRLTAVGDRVSLPLEVARRAVEHGAAEFATTD
jgi:hypothetical protein